MVAKFGNKGRKTRSLDHRIEPSALGIKVDGHVNGIGAIEDHKVEASMEKERKRLSYGGEKRHSRRLSGQFSYGAEGAQEGNSQPPQEDLFLNLANTDAGDDGVVDGSREQRRVSPLPLPLRRPDSGIMIASLSYEKMAVWLGLHPFLIPAQHMCHGDVQGFRVPYHYTIKSMSTNNIVYLVQNRATFSSPVAVSSFSRESSSTKLPASQ